MKNIIKGISIATTSFGLILLFYYHDYPNAILTLILGEVIDIKKN